MSLKPCGPGSRPRWRPHPAWLPLTPFYWAGSRLHAAWMRARARESEGPPLVIVGALRAGGSGKTSVTSALARELRARGVKVGILAWRIGEGLGRAAAQPVAPGSDWRMYSDEAVLLARETGCPVFAVRDRAAARRELSGAGFDLLLSDDGYQDRRLAGAFRILLLAPGEAPRFSDLLPAGPFRETAAARGRAHLVLEGPWPEGGGWGEGSGAAPWEPSAQGAHRFRRRFHKPDLPAGRPLLALATLGDPAPFLSDLARAGIPPAALIHGRNHRELPYAAMLAAWAARPGAIILCTPKEAVRLDRDRLGGPEGPEEREIAVARQEILLAESAIRRVMEACVPMSMPAAAGPRTDRPH
jgi:tetraacyldisaccharide 4'-kinase